MTTGNLYRIIIRDEDGVTIQRRVHSRYESELGWRCGATTVVNYESVGGSHAGRDLVGYAKTLADDDWTDGERPGSVEGKS